MKIGLDGVALPGLQRDAWQTLEFAQEHGLGGAFFGTLPALGPQLQALLPCLGLPGA